MADTIYNKTADPTLDVYKPAKVLQISLVQRLDIKLDFTMMEKVILVEWRRIRQIHQYTITFTVTEYAHGSHKTRESRKYNGMDVSVGDWIAGSQDGKCLQIVSVTSKSATSKCNSNCRRC